MDNVPIAFARGAAQDFASSLSLVAFNQVDQFEIPDFPEVDRDHGYKGAK